MGMPDPQMAPAACRVGLLVADRETELRLEAMLEAGGLLIGGRTLAELQDPARTVDVLVIDTALLESDDSTGGEVQAYLDRASIPALFHDAADTRYDESIGGRAWGRRFCRKLQDLVEQRQAGPVEVVVSDAGAQAEAGARWVQMDVLQGPPTTPARRDEPSGAAGPDRMAAEEALGESGPPSGMDTVGAAGTLIVGPAPDVARVAPGASGASGIPEAGDPAPEDAPEGAAVAAAVTPDLTAEGPADPPAAGDAGPVPDPAADPVEEFDRALAEAAATALHEPPDEDDTGVFEYSEADWQRLRIETTGLTDAARQVWVLGASIGGPQAVKDFLAHLPPELPMGFVLAQHIGETFVPLLAEQLGRVCGLRVCQAEEGFVIRNNELLVAPVGARIVFNRHGAVEFRPEVEASVYSPSIDGAMQAVASYYGPNGGAILFSGMGNDGVEGGRAIAARGGQVWAQEEESCIVSSMVACARESGVIGFSGTPEELAAELVRFVCEERAGGR